MADNFPQILTKRLLLRQIVQADVQHVFEGLSHPDVIRYYGVSYSTLEATQEQMDWFRKIWEEGTGTWWGICFRDRPDELLGACGFNNWSQKHNHAEIGYWLLPPYQRKGIMSEAIPAIMQHAYNEMHLHRITAIVEPENIGSIWLLEKMGFAQEGLFKDAEYKNGKYIDILQYAIISPNDRSI
ncbi:MAG TPA: GNAT family protein [Phnomibacter sp.]|nr:GNAT family protein [Phnomibacter sp.]